MIVVDTSVWIDLFRQAVTPGVQRLRAALYQEIVLVGDLILHELLRGFASEHEAELVRRQMRRFAFSVMGGREIAERAAGNYRLLRRRGVTVRKSIDMLIGTFCIDNGYRLLHSDRDFRPMVEHLGLLEA